MVKSLKSTLNELLTLVSQKSIRFQNQIFVLFWIAVIIIIFFLNFNKLQIKNFMNLKFINLSTGPLKLPSKTLQQLQAEQKTNLLQC